MPLSRRAGRLLTMAVAVPGVALVVVGSGGLLGWAQTATGAGCNQFATYDALGSAQGIQSVQAVPGATLVQGMDANLPGAQAEFNSSRGSFAWAGAPYSDTVAGNVGNANVNPNQIPIFAVSSYPAQPSGGTTTAASSVQTTSSASDSTAHATAAGVGPASSASGQVSTTASASCTATGTLKGVSDSSVNAFTVGGVLRIGAVTSHADATLLPGGTPVLNGTTSISDTTVLGQPVEITQNGLVIPGSAVALPSNPLASALSTAGISIQYLAVSKDPANGDVIAPGVAITVTANDQGLAIGAGTASTTFILGQAHARAIETGGGSSSSPTTVYAPPAGSGASPTVPTAPPSSPTSATNSGIGSVPAASGPIGTVVPTTSPLPGSQLPASSGSRTGPTSLIAAPSTSSFYAAVAVGGALLLIATGLFAGLGVRLKWR